MRIYPIAINETPLKYAWLSANGIILGSIDVSKQSKGTQKETLPDAYDILNEFSHIQLEFILGSEKRVGQKRKVEKRYILINLNQKKFFLN